MKNVVKKSSSVRRDPLTKMKRIVGRVPFWLARSLKAVAEAEGIPRDLFIYDALVEHFTNNAPEYIPDTIPRRTTRMQVIALTNQIINDAIDDGASEVRLNPNDGQMCIEHKRDDVWHKFEKEFDSRWLPFVAKRFALMVGNGSVCSVARNGMSPHQIQLLEHAPDAVYFKIMKLDADV